MLKPSNSDRVNVDAINWKSNFRWPNLGAYFRCERFFYEPDSGLMEIKRN